MSILDYMQGSVLYIFAGFQLHLLFLYQIMFHASSHFLSTNRKQLVEKV